MWILVEVNDPHDVGKNEKTRYVLSDNLTIVDDVLTSSIVALGNKVHPATPPDAPPNIIDVLEHCGKLLGQSGLPWRTLHEFFWFVSASKWGGREGCSEEEREVYAKFNGRPVGDASFEKMLLDQVLFFEEYCENEYGEIEEDQIDITLEEYDALFDAMEMIEPDIRKQIRAQSIAKKFIDLIDQVLKKMPVGDNE